MSIYEFQEVEVQNNGQVILKNINLEINSGQHIAITGPSGSGKTTFLKLFNRLIEPSSGSIVFEGNPLGDMDHTHLRRQAVMVFQEPILIEEIVSQDLLYPFNLRRFAERTPSEKELFKALEAVSLPPSFLNRSSKELSGGEKQRVALARAILLRPRVLLMDEPTSALDTDLAAHLLAGIESFHKPRAMLFITHSPEILEQAHRFLTIKEGTIHEGVVASDT